MKSAWWVEKGEKGLPHMGRVGTWGHRRSPRVATADWLVRGGAGRVEADLWGP